MANGKLWRGALAGAAGGLVGSWVMNQFQHLISGSSHDAHSHGPQSSKASLEGSRARIEDPTTRTSQLAKSVLGVRPRTNRSRDGVWVHYAFGAGVGAAYGMYAESNRRVEFKDSIAMGLGVWLVFDHMVLPGLGLSKPTTKYPASVHVNSFVSHILYGTATEVTRRYAVQRIKGLGD